MTPWNGEPKITWHLKPEEVTPASIFSAKEKENEAALYYKKQTLQQAMLLEAIIANLRSARIWVRALMGTNIFLTTMNLVNDLFVAKKLQGVFWGHLLTLAIQITILMFFELAARRRRREVLISLTLHGPANLKSLPGSALTLVHAGFTFEEVFHS